jgi:hypothetical protein
MRRESRILLTTLALGGLWVGGKRAWQGMVAMETFRVRDVKISGTRFLDRDQVLHALGLTNETSVWSDPGVWAENVAGLRLVKDARVTRRMPGTLVVSVVERRPVALVPTPTLEPVDARGEFLPIDPAEHRLDLPIIDGVGTPVPGAHLLPWRGRRLAAELARLSDTDGSFVQGVSEVTWKDDHTLVIRWSDPQVDFLVSQGAPSRRLREGLTVLQDAMARDGSHAPAVIDLRYADQVVVRRTR